MNRESWVRLLRAELWAILPLALDRIIAADGQIEAASARPASRAGSVAVLPIYGPISRRANFLSMLMGGTSVEAITAMLRPAVADESVGGIVLDVDSPGGTVDGIPELADEIHAARGTKTVVAVANTMAASAAYWLASQADELIVSPSAEVGSIGVFALHEDVSRALDSLGVTVTMIAAGKYKVEGNPFEPLGEEARAAIQGRVDDYYGQFVAAVARGRGVTAANVRAGYGEGRVVGANEAVRLGMADRVATMTDTLRRLADPRRRGQVGRGKAAEIGPFIEDQEIGAQADLDLRRRRLRLRSGA